MSVATKNLTTEQMTKISQGKGNEYTLLYYPFHGVCATVRAMLAMSDLKHKFTHPTDWPSQKEHTPFGHMPVLYETSPATGETIELAELSAIEFYLGQKLGLVGSNAWEENLIRSYVSSSQTLFDKFVVTVLRSPKELQPQMKELFMKLIPEWATFHEKILQANGANGHYIGDKLTVADIKTVTVIDVMMVTSQDMFITREKTPALLAVKDSLEKNEKYTAWKSSEDYKACTEATRALFARFAL
ncbi:hypothetical protein EMPS_00220 [Entomortierella parvispora]|uniref:Glutathione S-transferase n=1 Tax=Entomortierella parvispora TaxID=205924 RepID=A0A9P3GZV2_9FUNG|nr:hypothetical protein EMPS_00220 [Entomortierella parvispora]